MGLIVSASANEYRQQLLQLQPSGAFWPVNTGSVWLDLLYAFSLCFNRVDVNAVNFLGEAFPDTTDQLLPNWMAVCGLPDSCSIPGESTTQERFDVLAKLAGRGGQSAPYYQLVLSSYSYSSVVQNAAPYPVGLFVVGMTLFTTIWPFYWLINVTGVPSDIQSLIECRINQIAPAHTTVMFNFT